MSPVDPRYIAVNGSCQKEQENMWFRGGDLKHF